MKVSHYFTIKENAFNIITPSELFLFVNKININEFIKLIKLLILDFININIDFFKNKLTFIFLSSMSLLIFIL